MTAPAQSIAALRRVTGKDDRLYREANYFLSDIMPEGRFEFHDTPGRTQQEVVAKLRKVATKALAMQP